MALNPDELSPSGRRAFEAREAARLVQPMGPHTQEEPDVSDEPKKKRGRPRKSPQDASTKPDAPKGKRKYTKRQKPSTPAGAARFAVWTDDSVQIDAPGCKGSLTRADAERLHALLDKMYA